MSRFDVSKMLEMYDRGLGCPAIGRELGCAATTVEYHIRRRLGSLRKAKRIDWPIEQMRTWYEQDGKTLQEIADLLGQKQKVVNKVAKRHGFQMRRTGPPSGQEHPGWKGGRTIDKSGYVLVYRPDHPQANISGYVREHRLVMEQVLGRPLLPTEVVHHKDDNRQNNAPENLKLFQSNGAHLAETLQGKVPNWTPEGRARLLAGSRKKKPRKANRKSSAPDGSGSQQTTAHCSA